MGGRSKSAKLTHIGDRGQARMVDVGSKEVTERRAVASGRVRLSDEAMNAVREGRTAKGNVVETARLAGIQAAKRTAELIPLCHPLMLNHVDVLIEDIGEGFEIRSEVRCDGRTGVEMEALTAVAVAALTIYDMVKAVDRSMVIGEIQLLEKQGGRSGHYQLQKPRGSNRRRESL